MSRMTEHEAFASCTDHLAQAIAALRVVAQHREDTRDLWLQLAQTLGITRESIFRLAGDGAVKSKGKLIT